MPTVLRGKFFLVLVFLIVFSLQVSAQVGCGGFNGAPQPSGGITSDEPGSLCLNDPIQLPATINILASNVADGSNPNNFAVVIDWDDGSALQTITYGGAVPITYNAATHRYEINNIPHVFLPKPCNATMGRQCAYKPRVYLRIAGATCPAEFGNPPDFFRYNTDDQCSGNMNLSETATGAVIYEVCAGAATTVTFTDRTVINCLPPQELTGLNSKKRWRRFTYGTTTSITEGGAADQILVNGVSTAFPFTPTTTPAVSTDNLTSSAPPFANNNTLSITIPATAQVGEEFHIRMEYWNICNVYDDGVGVAPVNGDRPSVFRDGIIRVVGQPAPPTAEDEVVCNNIAGNLPDFSIDFAAGSSRVFWSRDNNGVRGTSITNPNGNNSRTFPASAFPGGGINKATPGVYRMWARYRSRVNNAGLFCESIDVPVTITVRPAIPNPIFNPGTSPVCNGTTGVDYSLQVPASALTAPNPGNPNVSFATEYFWSTSNGGVTITSTNPGQGAAAQTATVSFNIPDASFGGANSMVVNIRAQRRFTTNSTFPAPGANCASNTVSFPVTVHRNTQAGTITPGVTACEGEDLGDITWTPGVGSIVRWELSTNGGGSWTTIGSFGAATTVDPSSLNLAHTGAAAVPTEYRIRAQVQNGTCPMLATPAAIYLINENADIAAAGPDQPLCGILSTPLAATNATGTWSIISGPAGASFSSNSNPGATFTAMSPGIYTLQWETDNGSCTSQDQVIITFGLPADMPVPIANDFCGLTGTLNSSAPLKDETVEWELISGPGTAAISNTASNSSAVTVSVFGSYTFEITFTSPAGCGTPQTASVTYNFFDSPTVTPEAAKTICVDGSVSPIAAIPITGTTGDGAVNGHWEIVTGFGTFTSSAGAVGSNIPTGTIADGYVPNAADYAAGTVTLRLVSVGNVICTNATGDLIITFDRLPAAANAGTPFSTCDTDAVLNATAPTQGGVGTWSEITIPGPTVETPTQRNSPVHDLVTGANTFEWRVESALGVCPATTNQVTITRDALPNANAITIDDLCETVPNSGTAQNVDLTAYESLITASGTVLWFRDATRMVPVPDPTSEDVRDPLFTRVVGTCSAESVVTFDIKKPPFVANLTPAICEDPNTPGAVQNVNLEDYNDDVSLGLASGPTPARTVDWFADVTFTTPVTTPTDQDNVLNSATYYARVTDVVTGCFTPAAVVFDVNSIPGSNPIVGPDKVCLDPNNVVFFKVTNLNPGHTYQWTIPPPADGVTNTTGIDNDFFILLQFAEVVPGGLQISVTETSPDGCVGAPEDITVDVEDNPSALTITGPGEVCEGEVAVEYTADLFPNITYFWEVPVGASIISGQGTEFIRVNFGLASGDVSVIPSTTLGCTGSGTSIPVVVTPKPVLSTPDDEICSAQLANVQLTTVSNEPDLTFNVLTRVDDAGLAQMAGQTIPPAALDVAGNFLAADQFLNVTGGPLNTRYTIQPKILLQSNSRICLGNTRIITVKINPEPQLDPALNKDLCSGESTGITLRSAVGNVKADAFIINSITNPAGLASVNPPVQIGVQLPETAIIDDQWIYNGFGPTFQTVTYEVSPVITSTGCVGSPASILSVRVFPNPTVILPAPPTICNGEGQSISLTTPNVPTATISATVSFVDANISGAQSQVNSAQPALISQVLMNNSYVTSGIVQYSIVAQNADNKSCVSPIESLSVTVNPAPEVNLLDPLDGCAAVLNSGIYTATLADVEPLLTDAANTIAWFQQDPTNNPGAQPILTPTFNVQDMVPIFAQVTNSFNCQLAVPVVYDVNNAVVLAVNVTDATCFDADDGSVQALATFGTPPFTFQKNTDPAVTGSGALQDQFLYTGLGPDTYTISVQDSRGCTASAPATISEPTPLDFAQGPVVDNVECFFDPTGQSKDKNGRITVTAGGSSGDYIYELSPGGLSQHISDGSQCVFDNLLPGSYALTITDFATFNAKKCKTEKSPVIVAVPTPVKISQVFVSTDSYGNSISCFGAQNGQVEVTTIGGTGTYEVTFIPFNPPDAVAATENVPVVFSGLAPASYQIQVVDGNGCQASPEFATIIDVPILTPGVVGTDRDICFNQNDPAGDAQPFNELVSAFGGNSGPYIFQWQAFDQGTNQWVDVPGATNANLDPDQNGPFSAVGQYSFRRGVANSSPVVKLSDHVLKGCDAYKYGNEVKITVHPKPTTSVTLLGGVCKGDTKTVTLELINGTAPMFFNFFDGVITRNNETGGQFSQPYQILLTNNVIASFTNIRDTYGCIADDQFVPIDVTSVAVDFDPTPLTQCAGQPFTFTYGVDTNLDYLWDFGDGSSRSYFAGTAPGLDTYTYPTSITTQSAITFDVKLTASIGGACPASIVKKVTVNQSINLDLSNPPSEICSGEAITIEDNSTGVATGTYYYQDIHGTRGGDVNGPLPTVQFLLPPGPDLPFTEYNLHYDAFNSAGCPASAVLGPIRVYMTPVAAFTINPNPAQMVAGVVAVDFINSSTPLDNTQFSYAYDYPIVDVVSVTDPNPYDKHVEFSSEKNKEVTLTVHNLGRPACKSIHFELLQVDLAGALADFNISPSDCTPIHVTTENLSVSFDIFEWELTGPDGFVQTSNLTEPEFDLNQPGVYSLTLRAAKAGNSISPVTTAPKTVEVLARPTASFFLRQDQVYTGSQVKPVNETTNACDGCWTWDFGDGFTYEDYEPTHIYTLEGRYTVSLEAWIEYDVDGDGTPTGNILCNDIAVSEIRVLEGGKVKIPNAFTPNVNGPNGGTPDKNFTNDVFLPIMDGVEEFTMQIFDRWGNMLFQSTEQNQGWDGYDKNGKLMPAGVYVYKVVLRLDDGERTTKIGDVTLIR
jgi:gliding motility-associated-like protein